MDNKIAQTHTHSSNRAKNKEEKDKKDKKVVFKGVLDTPFRITWPSVSINVQMAILDEILQSLKDFIASSPSAMSGKRKRRATDEGTSEQNEQTTSQVVEKEGQTESEPHFIYGINAVTRRLESDIRHLPTLRISPDTAVQETPKHHPLKCVFVCRADVNPSLIIDHLPHLVAAYNSRQSAPILLVPLPKGAEQSIAEVLGVRRAAVLALDTRHSFSERASQLLQEVAPLRASWLSGIEGQELIPTHTKHLRTTAPKDMKAAKILRTEERAQTKKKKKLLKASS